MQLLNLVLSLAQFIRDTHPDLQILVNLVSSSDIDGKRARG
eukprot:SAG31_NODE_25775_length_454_cov_1.315493_1_plen_40_part_10